MKKRKIIVVLTLMLVCTVNVNAQFGGLLNRVKQKTKDRIERKVDRTVDKVLDGAERKVDNTVNDAVKGKDGAAETRANVMASAQDTAPRKASIGWNNYDFVSGMRLSLRT